ncbi:MAG: GNAT family N-acetyltransferase [Bacteroidota bacterium]
MQQQLKLRNITREDTQKISRAFACQGWHKPISQYEQYIEYQENGERDIIIATIENEFAGYLTIQWKSNYLPFRAKKIPEVVDFNVLKKFQRRGIGTALMDEAEMRISGVSRYAGIGFGVHRDYSAAQILYIKRNYIPDGNGLVRNARSLEYGEKVEVNDDLVFYLTKEL